jgi:aldose 1-epimerase
MPAVPGIADFGTTPDGTKVQRITISSGELTVSVLTWGAILNGVWLAGLARNLTLASDSLADYLPKMRHHGALVAPVVNRFSGGTAKIGGVEHEFAKNQAGKHTLHSGPTGAHLRAWEIAEVAADRVVLTIALPDGEGGFPGNRVVRAEFAVKGAGLRLTVTATTDKVTLFNAANHSYWNLDGTPTFAGHHLKIAAFAMLPTTDDFCPTGEIRPVEGTDFDFRREREISPGNPAMDNNFCLAMGQGHLRDVLWLTGTSGLGMTVATTEAGIQVYDARNAQRPGHGLYEGLAIEAQNWPDAPNRPGFPSIELSPGETRSQVTQWQFSKG